MPLIITTVSSVVPELGKFPTDHDGPSCVPGVPLASVHRLTVAPLVPVYQPSATSISDTLAVTDALNGMASAA